MRAFFRNVGIRWLLRPFSVTDHNRIRFYGNRIDKRFRAFQWRYQQRSASELIRNLFITNPRYNSHCRFFDYPSRLDAYEIGSNIACGCHAAVYELRRTETRDPDVAFVRNTGLTMLQSQPTESFSASVQDRLLAYPLALKIMFNYDFKAPEHSLWTDMGSELVPLIQKQYSLAGRMRKLKMLPRPHPNVIKMYTAFTDRMPILPDSYSLYPEALPSLNFCELAINEPKTLFIVMKRYRMTLREYVLIMKRNYWKARVMYAQLLEAITYLYDHTISHRDLKSDNILLDFDSDEDTPHLVVCDFGCALVTGSWIVDYQDDSVDLGGNLALRAPEVSCACPGPRSFVDFRLADLWASATLGYEIFTRSNPFYSMLKSHSYMEDELPQLPKRVHYAVRLVTKDMLRRDPKQRPDPHVAANVVSFSLFRYGENIRKILDDCGLDELFVYTGLSELKTTVSATISKLKKKVEETFDDLMLLYATETMVSRRLCPGIISSAELQVWNSTLLIFNL
ncbi:unnamed protein product [Enterobius vermicularis]|uniref:non-specific serine/threonine protein kinase n=1 Tax=Enterobius vermicularis TaxID=51028 RepID=A0A3P6HYH1_ENTVE|nr:unnamed protein product [Enterobius vermicularis]